LKKIYILALEMASPGNQHCADCIGALAFAISGFKKNTLTAVVAGEPAEAVSVYAERRVGARPPQLPRDHVRRDRLRLQRVADDRRRQVPVLARAAWRGGGVEQGGNPARHVT